MRIVFLGTPSQAVPALDALIEAGHDLPLVVSRPDRPVGRSRRPLSPPVKQAAVRHGLEVLQPLKVRDRAFREALEAARPDLLLVVAYGRILSRAVLDVPRLGAVNLHFSLLPAYRGAAPVQWALANGETRTGVTTMLMNEGLDEGEILDQREIEIEEGEHAPALATRLAVAGAGLLGETVALLASGRARPRPQDHARSTHAPILERDDGEVDLRLHAREIEGRVRGFDPWPGVWVSNAGRRLRILEGRAVPGPGGDPAPGTLLGLTGEAMVLVCGEGSRLLVTRLQAEGKRAISAIDAVNGRVLGEGDRFDLPSGN